MTVQSPDTSRHNRRRQRLDAEEEGLGEAARPRIRQRTANRSKERGEDNVY